jgi:hypothetical protein
MRLIGGKEIRSVGKLTRIAAVVFAIGFGGAQVARAQFTTPELLNGSTVTITQTADVTNPGLKTVTGPVALPSVAPGSYQLGSPNKLSDGTANSTADAGVYGITGNNNLGIGMTTGTGVTQLNNSVPAFSGPANLELNVDANWFLPSGYPQIGSYPSLTYQFALGGTVSKGGYDEVTVNLNVTDTPTGRNSEPVSLPGISFTDLYYNGTPPDVNYTNRYSEAVGKFTPAVISGVDFLDLSTGAPLPVGSTLTISGTLDFYSADDLGGSSIQVVDVSGVPLPKPLAMGGAAMLMIALAQGWKWARSAD